MLMFRSIVAFAVAMALAAPALPAPHGAVTGSFPEGQLYSPPEFHAPAHVSRFSVRTLELSGGRVTADVRARGEGPLWVWMVPVVNGRHPGAEAGVGYTIISPSGREVTRRQPGQG